MVPKVQSMGVVKDKHHRKHATLFVVGLVDKRPRNMYAGSERARLTRKRNISQSPTHDYNP